MVPVVFSSSHGSYQIVRYMIYCIAWFWFVGLSCSNCFLYYLRLGVAIIIRASLFLPSSTCTLVKSLRLFSCIPSLLLASLDFVVYIILLTLSSEAGMSAVKASDPPTDPSILFSQYILKRCGHLDLQVLGEASRWWTALGLGCD